MKVRMLKTQESPTNGVLEKGEVYDLDPRDERLYIERGIAINVSAPEYVSQSARKTKKQQPKKRK